MSHLLHNYKNINKTNMNEIQTNIVTKTVFEDNLYILDKTPFVIEDDLSYINKVYVPQDSYDGYVELNSYLTSYIHKYNYTAIGVERQPFYDNIAVIMTNETNAPVMEVMHSKGLAYSAYYMTLAEAKAVTNEDCSQLFDGNTSITSFNEFQYFTNVTDCGSYFARNAYNLESIILPKSLRIIPPRMFTITTAVWNSGIRGHLKYVGNTEQIEEVGQVAFQYQQLPFSLNFTQKLKKIGISAFLGNYNTRNLDDMSMSMYITSFGDLSGVEEIVGNPSNGSSAAFLGQQNLKSVNMPKMTQIPLNLFCNCHNLSSINVDWDNLTSIGGYSLVHTAIENIPNCPKLTTIGTSACDWCLSLKTIGDMPLLTAVPKYAFTNNYNLVKVGNMDSVTSIGTEAFAACNWVRYFKFPSCTSVGKWAFGMDYGYDNKRTIEFGKPYEEISFNSQTFVIVHDNEVTPCTNTTIICNGIELTEEQYEAVGAQKPE